jgi:hypothetical protein
MQGETSAAEQTSQATVAESHKLKELHNMIYGNMSREYSVPLATYVKFEVCRENHDKAEQARCERAERDQIRTEKARAQYEATQERRAKVRGRNSNATKELMERNLEHSQMIRATKLEWDRERERERERLAAITREKVLKARANDSRLDASEELAAEEARQQGTQARLASRLALQSFRENLIKERQERVEHTRAQTSRAAVDRVSLVGSR